MNFKEKNIMAYSINGMVSSPEEISELFSMNAQTEEQSTKQDSQETEENQETKETETKENTEIDDPLELFKGDQSERVGDEDDDNNQEEQERATSEENEEGSSPKLYSSVAHSLAEEGALSYLTDEEIDNIKDAESFVEAVRKNNEAQLDEMQKRVNDALNAGVQPDLIKQYESTIAWLNNLSEDSISEEGENGENLRKSLIYQYYITSGASEDRARKMVDRALENGTDIDDAKEFLEDLKKHYTDEYKAVVDSQKAQVAEAKKKQEEETKKLKKDILEDKKLLGDIEVDAKTRQLAFDYLMKPTHKTENGIYQSEMQKYIADNPVKFQKVVSVLFALSNKFENFDNILKGNVKKVKKEALKNLEDVINGSKRTPSGAIDFGSRDKDSSFNIKFAPPELWKR